MYRENNAVIECIHHAAVIELLAEPGIKEIFLLISGSLCSIGERASVHRGPSQAIFTYGLILKATAPEILVTYGLTFLRLQTLLKELACIFRDKD